jgi:ATP-dependent helicase/nuclease subunit B
VCNALAPTFPLRTVDSLAFPRREGDNRARAQTAPERPPLTDVHLFSIPAGAPFAPTLARALVDGALIPGFPGDGGPLALAEATIYVPTQRAAAALTQALLATSGQASLILPRIAPLGAFEPSRDALDSAADRSLADEAIPAAVSELARRMALARLTRAWGQALRGAIRGVDAEGQLTFDPGEPPLVAASPAQAFALAGDLAGLIDDFIIEGVDPERLNDLVADRFDPYWGVTLNFLKIAFAHWPDWLAERRLIDPARRAQLAIDAEIQTLAAGGRRGPTIVAGSTGANSATTRLMAAVARAPQGAVVLPDLDRHLDDAAWTMLGDPTGDAVGVAGHPQAILHRLLEIVGVGRDAVQTLGEVGPALALRARFLSQALRPADSTDAWRREHADDPLADAAVEAALAGVAIVAAADENEEALALACAMREALETPGRSAALVTPDVAVARRVAAELARWGVEVEPSAGRPLGETQAGVFARLSLAAARDFAPAPLAALFGDRLTRLGRSASAFDDAARALEIGVLRIVLPPAGLANPAKALAAARQAQHAPHAHPARRRLTEADWSAAAGLLADCAAALAPLRALGPDAPLADFIVAHRGALAALAAEDADWRDASGGEALASLLEEWTSEVDPDFRCSLADYASLFDAVLAAQRAPPLRASHPRLQILGLLEARLLAFDLTLLAGLDETVWPPAAETDAFLNRSLRAALGLSPPERRVGQTAHDFVAALGAPQVVISRARKRGGSPTVASRFLQRVAAVAGEGAYAAAEARGARYLALAQALDRPAAYRPRRRPEPRPPLALRPAQLSVTRIETLRRDPYAIFAERILGLEPLAPIGPEIGPREIGDLWHAALQAYADPFIADASAAEARTRLLSLAATCFAAPLADPSFRALRWPRIVAGLDAFLAFDAERRAGAESVLVERRGKFEFSLDDGSPFTLTARADRIELLRGGGAALIDYKTGAPPGKREVEVGFAPQLTLEATMLAHNGFEGAPPVETVEALYFKLGGAAGGEVKRLAFDHFGAVVARHFDGLKALLGQFANPATPYPPRLFPKFAKRPGDYDHLARVKEWSATAGQSDEPTADEA